MIINLNKDKFKAIDGAFRMLKENPTANSPKDIIRESLESCFKGLKFDIHIVEPIGTTDLFIMSVYPEISTADSIVNAILNGKSDKIVEELWRKNTKWTIEIDIRILTTMDFTDRELTSLLLHEVGHVVNSNSIIHRLYVIMNYELSKTRLSTKLIANDKLFRGIMSLPILDACISDKKKNGLDIKEEIKADNFVKKMGYSNELYSVLKKIYSSNKIKSDKNEAISKITNFGLDTLDLIHKRKDNLAGKNLALLKQECASPYVEKVIDKFVSTVLEGSDDENSNFTKNKKLNIMHERMDNIVNDGYYREFFIFGTKKLKRIDPSELDYIAIKLDDIESDSDKMMLITYIHNKLDLIEYYMSILENPNLSKKYSIPHSYEQLKAMHKRLSEYRTMVLKYKIKPYNPQIFINYPKGYEG